MVQFVHRGHLIYFFYKVTVSYEYTNVMCRFVCEQFEKGLREGIESSNGK